ncbi:CocE/NonD family hydrolase [Streptomyces niveus]|uniref:CocE/NonD family hydrolase n=1 Tax=Streptomyces niveus TaxID=193462 RepID=UPI0036AD3B60
MRYIEVPTRDGTVLRGFHYAPAEPGPVVLVLTPYGADRFHRDGEFFADRGYHFVSVDSRGRGGSDGEFRPFHDDGADGHDAVTWLADQPFARGGVVTYGGSYSGFVQWAVASTRPPALRGLAPAASVYPGVDFPAVGGIPTAYAVQWLSYTHGRRLNTGPWADDERWRKAHRDLGNRPFRDLDIASVGERLPAFQEWLDHPAYDDYWASFVPSEPTGLPVLTVTGQYDDDQLGALTYLEQHPPTHTASRLVIGPWDHAGTRSAANTFGGLNFPADSAIDLLALHADWYDWILDRGPCPNFLAEPVTYYHIGAGWRHAPSLHEKQPTLLRLPETTLVMDPALVEDEPQEFREELADGAFVHTTPAHDVSGRPRAVLNLSTDLPDFDLLVQLYLLRDDATLLSETVFRARHHDLTAGPVELTLPFISRTAEPGDRFGTRIRAPHRRYETNHAARGEVRLGTDSYLAIPAAEHHGSGPGSSRSSSSTRSPVTTTDNAGR